LRVKGPFHIFRIKKDEKGKMVFDSKDKTQEDHWFPDSLEPFYEGYLHIGKGGKVELVLLNAFPPEWLDEIEQRTFACWVREYLKSYYNSFLGDKEFPVTIECREDVTI